MNVIATTSQSILLVDCASGAASVLHRGAGLYYGVARMGGSYAVAARRRLVSSPGPRADERGCILTFDGHFVPGRTIEAPFPLRDVHQIAWFDGRLWVTCSFDDFVAVFDGNAWERWSPDAPGPRDTTRLPPEAPADRHHYNSFLVAADEVALLAHSHGPSDIHVFDRHSLALRRSLALGAQAHNIWRDGDAYMTCSSIEGKLVGSDGWGLVTGGFPRGVALGAAHRAVGISARSERGQRDFASAAIALYDAAWRPLHYVHLEGEGMVLDLLRLPQRDAREAAHAALERRRFPLLSRLTDADLLPGQASSGSAST